MVRALAVVLAGARSWRQNQRMPTLELYPFRLRDPRTGKWIRARHKLQVPESQRRYAEWEITGPPEIRDVQPQGTQQFSPFLRPAQGPAIIAPMLLWMR
jgi:hypothetical protein